MESGIFDAYYALIAAGCIGIVQYRLGSGTKETPEHMALMTEQIILKGIRVFEAEDGDAS